MKGPTLNELNKEQLLKQLHNYIEYTNAPITTVAKRIGISYRTMKAVLDDSRGDTYLSTLVKIRDFLRKEYEETLRYTHFVDEV